MKPHGFRGEVNAIIDFDLSEEEIKSLIFVFDIDGILVPFFCSTGRILAESKWLLKFDDINSDTAIKPFVNKEIYFLRSQIAETLGVDEMDLETVNDSYIGYIVKNSVEETVIGIVEDIEEGIEYDYLIVKNPENKLIQIPFIDEIVPVINEKDENNQGEIFVDLPEGLLELF